ncbi:hypothetical protein [Ruegeria denitrificans]|uniref:hypothetical protein n=1 Tax=Ruegeria denitrificans TaxID=1715692 RepID=UPI003C7D2346
MRLMALIFGPIMLVAQAAAQQAEPLDVDQGRIAAAILDWQIERSRHIAREGTFRTEPGNGYVRIIDTVLPTENRPMYTDLRVETDTVTCFDADGDAMQCYFQIAFRKNRRLQVLEAADFRLQTDNAELVPTAEGRLRIRRYCSGGIAPDCGDY